MAEDFALPVRRAILPRLKADPAVTLLIPAARIYPVTTPANPVYPFTRYGASIVAPYRATGLASSVITVAIHAFTKYITNASGAVTMTAEDAAAKMAAAIVGAMDDVTLPLEDGAHKARVTWTGTNLLQDPSEASTWHAVVNLRVEVSG